MAATLANRGVNPVTGKRAIEARYAKNVLTVMHTSGMYDFAGEWLYRVGLPAESGVAGSILVVVPDRFGLAILATTRRAGQQRARNRSQHNHGTRTEPARVRCAGQWPRTGGTARTRRRNRAGRGPIVAPLGEGERSGDGRVSLARIRHDLLTPVNAIIGYSELLLEDAEDDGAKPEIVADLTTIRHAGREALNGVVELLGEQAREAQLSPTECVLRGDAPRRMLKGPSAAVLTSCASLIDCSDSAGALRADVEKIESAVGFLAALLEQVFAPASTPPLTAATPVPAVSFSDTPEQADANARATLLVVDDTATNRDVLTRRLQREGFAVRTAADGECALTMLRAEKFDLVLLDIVMPVMDGYGVLSALKADADLCDIPVIMISALDEVKSVARCIEMGAEDYLPKSFNPTVLRARIHASLTRKFFRDRE